MSNVFRFKQFIVDQEGCAMKVNTDGVLLGALAMAANPQSALDIGTGTGVIALMLAQRFPDAQIEAVEIDEPAAKTAERNFVGSPFAGRLRLHACAFQDYQPGRTYDLIVSNPPFFLNSLKNPAQQKVMARHTDTDFFREMIAYCRRHLSPQGLLWMILPVETAALVSRLAAEAGLTLRNTISIQSFPGVSPHRLIVAFGATPAASRTGSLIIYSQQNVYATAYRDVMQPFLTIF